MPVCFMPPKVWSDYAPAAGGSTIAGALTCSDDEDDQETESEMELFDDAEDMGDDEDEDDE